MRSTARAKSAAARAGISTGTLSPGAVLATCAGVIPTGSPGASGPSERSDRGSLGGAGVPASGTSGNPPHADSAPAISAMSSIRNREYILHDLRLAVAARLQLGKCLKTALHGLVVHAVPHERGVHLVHGDGLLLEWKRLLFEQQVVLLERIGR